MNNFASSEVEVTIGAAKNKFNNLSAIVVPVADVDTFEAADAFNCLTKPSTLLKLVEPVNDVLPCQINFSFNSTILSALA
jgi:hypothetical protein